MYTVTISKYDSGDEFMQYLADSMPDICELKYRWILVSGPQGGVPGGQPWRQGERIEEFCGGAFRHASLYSETPSDAEHTRALQVICRVVGPEPHDYMLLASAVCDQAGIALDGDGQPPRWVRKLALDWRNRAKQWPNRWVEDAAGNIKRKEVF